MIYAYAIGPTPRLVCEEPGHAGPGAPSRGQLCLPIAPALCHALQELSAVALEMALVDIERELWQVVTRGPGHWERPVWEPTGDQERPR